MERSKDLTGLPDSLAFRLRRTFGGVLSARQATKTHESGTGTAGRQKAVRKLWLLFTPMPRTRCVAWAKT
ncbi:MAG: hypothetical protein LUI07_06810 [Lachnospiraceae bacterium]|nr:hypothetical protein [Lachnospiraceae bacterium]